jgi:uncharacterized protein YbjT (DUF2867 family)
MPRTALLFGATGLVGGHCLDILLRDDSYTKVTAFARRNLSVSHPKLTVEVIDFERPEEYTPLVVGDDLFCCLGTTIRTAGSQEAFSRVDFTYPHQIASAAGANGVGQFLLVSSLGADAGSSIFYNRVKGELENAVRKLRFHGIGIFRPSLLLGERKEVRLGEKIAGVLSAVVAPLLLGSLRKYRPIKARDVAAAMVAVGKKNAAGITVYESDAIAGAANLRESR